MKDTFNCNIKNLYVWKNDNNYKNHKNTYKNIRPDIIEEIY